MIARLYEKMKTSPKLEQEGIELNIGDLLKFQIGRAGGSNQKFNSLAAKLAKEHKRAIDNELLSDAKGMALMHELFAEAVVFNVWSNVNPDENGEPEWREGIIQPDGELAPVTFENVVKLFKDLPDVFLQVKDTAESMTYFRASLVEGVVKN